MELLARIKKRRIAIGLKERQEEILDSLRRGKQYADILLVGPEAIRDVDDFEVILADNPEEKLASMLALDEVEGIIRGTIDDLKTFEVYQRLTGERCSLNPGLLEDPKGRQFLMAPASNAEGWEKEERLGLAVGMAEFCRELGLEPRIAVFAGRRHETYPRKKSIRVGTEGILNKTYEDAEWIAAELQRRGYLGKNWAIDLNPAVEAGCNIIVPVNGMVGNQIFRVLLFCGSKLLAGPRLGLSRCYEDNSRTERDFESHVKWLVATINGRRSVSK